MDENQLTPEEKAYYERLAKIKGQSNYDSELYKLAKRKIEKQVEDSYGDVNKQDSKAFSQLRADLDPINELKVGILPDKPEYKQFSGLSQGKNIWLDNKSNAYTLPHETVHSQMGVTPVKSGSNKEDLTNFNGSPEEYLSKYHQGHLVSEPTKEAIELNEKSEKEYGQTIEPNTDESVRLAIKAAALNELRKNEGKPQRIDQKTIELFKKLQNLK